MNPLVGNWRTVRLRGRSRGMSTRIRKGKRRGYQPHETPESTTNMTFDFTTIRATRHAKQPVDPIAIFQSATVSDQGINDLWLAQGDALREWHENRDQPDVGVILNTGAGKTLVGMLVAQSLVNESSGHVLYACSSIQLIEQTAEKASGYGLSVTTYHGGEFSNDLFVRGLAPCITTYHALFNGKTRFVRYDIAAVVFDDAHTAEHLLRDHFSLTIRRTSFPDLYTKLTALFREYHHRIGRTTSYEEMLSDSSKMTFLVPPFEVARNAAEIGRRLRSAELDDSKETMFSWPHIRDREDLCCIFLSSDSITLTPPVVPVQSLPYFGNNVRRVYLSATLTAPDAFARTFGRTPSCIVAPSTTAGECERLILFPSKMESGHDGVDFAKALIDERKALVLVPTYERCKVWKDVAEPPPREAVTEAVNTFKKADPSSAAKLILAARYDGVDLPGDTCRVMVIDDIPMGSGPLERFLWESLLLSNSLRSALASRIVQSFGRISRGMSDHGVVVITGKRLVEWLLLPKNSAALPGFLQKQIQLGYAVSESVDSLDSLMAAANACLSRERQWVDSYGAFLRDAAEEDAPQDSAAMVTLALSETNFIGALWNRDYDLAAKCLSETLEMAFGVSASTGAWHCLWLGYALERGGDAGSAREMYARAHGVQRNIPGVMKESDDGSNSAVPRQIMEVDQQITVLPDGMVKLPKTLHSDLALLNGTGSAPQTEEALRCLGQFLGFKSNRPDKEFGTGPDVLWLVDDSTALCMEAKTDKKASGHY